MKKLVLFLFVILLSVGKIYSQEPLSFEKVINVDSVSKNDIYNSLKTWIGLTYISSKAVTEVEDKEAGIIIITPLVDYSIDKLQYMCYDGTLKYTLNFKVKDNRFKIQVINFLHTNTPGHAASCNVGLITTDEEYPRESGWGYKGYNNKIWKDIKTKAEKIANEKFEQLSKINFKKGLSNSKNDNW